MSKNDGLGIPLEIFGHFIMMWTVLSVVIITTNKTWELQFLLWFLFVNKCWVLIFRCFIVIILFVFVLCLLLTSGLL
jgi:hypothetical protein